MKKTSVLFLCLAFLSLACIWTASPMVTETPDSSASFSLPAEIDSGAVYEVPEDIGRIEPRTCARVTAEEALNLRNGPSEKEIILAWLNHGDLVQVIDQSFSDWWRVQFGDIVGFARSKYLEIQECD